MHCLGVAHSMWEGGGGDKIRVFPNFAKKHSQGVLQKQQNERCNQSMYF